MALPVVDDERYAYSPEPIQRARRDIRQAARTLTLQEVRYLVDLYYSTQGFRISSANQVRALEEGEEPDSLLTWSMQSFTTVEDEIRKGLDVFSRYEPTGLGQWARSIVGIGPVIASGLLAHIDIERAPTAGHIWRFAGLDPSTKWLGKEGARAALDASAEINLEALDPAELVTPEDVDAVVSNWTTLSWTDLVRVGQLVNRKPQNLVRIARDENGKITRTSLLAALSKRPWNASLKVLCWKLGESFVKVSSNKNDVYGKLYQERKVREIDRNERGELADQAASILQAKRISHDTDAYKAYAIGKLPPAHIHARAKRWAVKLFLAHFHTVGYFLRYEQLPPAPYPIVHLGHAHEIDVPNPELVPGLVEALAARPKP